MIRTFCFEIFEYLRETSDRWLLCGNFYNFQILYIYFQSCLQRKHSSLFFITLYKAKRVTTYLSEEQRVTYLP